MFKLAFVITLASTPLFSTSPSQADIAAWISETGGSFQKNPAGQIVEVDLTSTWITDDDLAKIAQLDQLQKLNLSYTKISDLGLEHLRPLRHVTYLNCYYCEYLSDGGIAFLKQYAQAGLQGKIPVFSEDTMASEISFSALGDAALGVTQSGDTHHLVFHNPMRATDYACQEDKRVIFQVEKEGTDDIGGESRKRTGRVGKFINGTHE